MTCSPTTMAPSGASATYRPGRTFSFLMTHASSCQRTSCKSSFPPKQAAAKPARDKPPGARQPAKTQFSLSMSKQPQGKTRSLRRERAAAVFLSRGRAPGQLYRLPVSLSGNASNPAVGGSRNAPSRTRRAPLGAAAPPAVIPAAARRVALPTAENRAGHIRKPLKILDVLHTLRRLNWIARSPPKAVLAQSPNLLRLAAFYVKIAYCPGASTG